MNFLIPILAVTFAAICVWLTVRIINRERWAKWTAAAIVVLPVLYLLSFGPAVWLAGRGYLSESTVSLFYWPVLWSTAHAETLDGAVDLWGSLWIPEDEVATLQIETDEASIVLHFSKPSTPHSGGMM
jgi:hypothetical protein